MSDVIAYDFNIPAPDGKDLCAANKERLRIAENMPIGASFLFEGINRNHMGRVIRRLKRRHKAREYVCRTLSVRGKVSVRVWRIADADSVPA